MLSRNLFDGLGRKEAICQPMEMIYYFVIKSRSGEKVLSCSLLKARSVKCIFLTGHGAGGKHFKSSLVKVAIELP